MTGRRFFIESNKINGVEAVLTGPDAHHLKNVLRLKPGASIQLIDGQGTIFTARIKKLGKSVDLKIEDRNHHPVVTPVIHLAQGLLKGGKMDFLIQKATELGINGFHPFTSRYSVAAKPAANKQKRWRKIMIEACKQSGRAEFLEIGEVADLAAICCMADTFERTIVFWEDEPEVSLQALRNLRDAGSILAVVGPEGGFHPEEIELAANHGFQSVRMGELTLRSESAAFSAMTILQFITGKFG